MNITVIPARASCLLNSTNSILLYVFFFLLFTPYESSASVRLSAGLRVQTAKVQGTTSASAYSNSYQLGIEDQQVISGEFVGLMGVDYTNRLVGANSATSANTTATGTFNFSSIDLPVLIGYAPDDRVAFFFGPIFSIRANSSCDDANSSTVCTDKSSSMLTIPLALRVHARVYQSFGFDVFFESTQGSDGTFSRFSQGVDSYRAVGANLTFDF